MRCSISFRSARCCRASLASASRAATGATASSSAASRLDLLTGGRADQAGEIRRRHVPQVARLHEQHALARGLGLGRRDLVGGHEPGRQTRARVGHVGLGAAHGLFQNGHRGAPGHHRPEGPRHFEPQVRPRNRRLGGGGSGFRARRANQRVGTAAAVDRPLHVQPRAVVVGHVRVQNARHARRARHHELQHVIRAGIACARGDQRPLGRHPRVHAGQCGGFPRTRLRQAVAGLECACPRIGERQLEHRLL